MAEELTRTLTLLAERGTPRGAEVVLADALYQLGAPRPRPSRRLVVVVAGAMVAALVAIMVLVLSMWTHDPAPVVDDPTPTEPSGAIGPVDPATYLSGRRVGLRRSGQDLWAFALAAGGDPSGRLTLARYHDGTWWGYPRMPAATLTYVTFEWDVAELPDGTIVAATAQGVQLLGPDGWRPHPDWRSVDLTPETPDARDTLTLTGAATVMTPPANLEVDPATGTVWVSTVTLEDENTTLGVGRLFRWDATGVTEVVPLDDMVDFHRLVRTADGSLWGRGEGGLVRYDPAADRWETVDPWSEIGLHGDGVGSMTATPSGDLWVVDFELQPVDGQDYDTSWYAAHLDVASGTWTVHPYTYLGFMPNIAADDGGLWLARMGDAGPGVDRFDGTAWTTHLPDQVVHDVAVAGDGTVWASHGSSVVRVPTEASTDLVE